MELRRDRGQGRRRVDFHLGWYGSARGPASPAAQPAIQQSLIDSREAALRHAAQSWDVAGKPPARLLDIGCGLGGGSIYWAQEHGSAVTGLTVTAAHLPLVAEFVRQAGVADQVRALLASLINGWDNDILSYRKETIRDHDSTQNIVTVVARQYHCSTDDALAEGVAMRNRVMVVFLCLAEMTGPADNFAAPSRSDHESHAAGRHAALFGRQLTMPSVHVTGRADVIVPRRDSLLLAV
jgi:Terpene synthase family 2, C-terminal metal binding/Mycolic acid cyclopropane synthetase